MSETHKGGAGAGGTLAANGKGRRSAAGGGACADW